MQDCVSVLLFDLRFQGVGFPGGSEGKESACNSGDPVRILSQEDPLENRITTHSSILAWEIS